LDGGIVGRYPAKEGGPDAVSCSPMSDFPAGWMGGSSPMRPVGVAWCSSQPATRETPSFIKGGSTPALNWSGSHSPMPPWSQRSNAYWGAQP